MAPRNDPLGDRIKAFERSETDRRAQPGQVAVVRIDGMGFSRFTRSMMKPYDPALGGLMIETSRYLVGRLGAHLAFTQSDEISLIFLDRGPRPFDGRLHKLATAAAAIATSFFVQKGLHHWPDLCRRSPPAFDGRAFCVPSRDDAVAVLVWRELDASRNSMSMAGRSHFPQRALQGVSRSEVRLMLSQASVAYDELSVHFRRGCYVARRPLASMLTEAELSRIPPTRRPQGAIVRQPVVVLDTPPIGQLLNPAAFLFDGEDALLRPSNGVKTICDDADLVSAQAEAEALAGAIEATPPDSRRRELLRLIAAYLATRDVGNAKGDPDASAA